MPGFAGMVVDSVIDATPRSATIIVSEQTMIVAPQNTTITRIHAG